MPRSKRPRKRHTPIKPHVGFTVATIDGIKDMFATGSLCVMEKLPRGFASFNEIFCLRDIINLTQVALVTRNCFDEKEIEAFQPELNAAGHIVIKLAKQLQKTGKIICHGDDLRPLQETFDECSLFVMDSIRDCPRRLMAEFETVQQINRSSHELVECTQGTVEEIKRMVNQNAAALNQRMGGNHATS